MTRIRHFGVWTAVIDDQGQQIDLRLRRYGDSLDHLSARGVEDLQGWALDSLGAEIDQGYKVVTST